MELPSLAAVSDVDSDDDGKTLELFQLPAGVKTALLLEGVDVTFPRSHCPDDRNAAKHTQVFSSASAIVNQPYRASLSHRKLPLHSVEGGISTSPSQPEPGASIIISSSVQAVNCVASVAVHPDVAQAHAPLPGTSFAMVQARESSSDISTASQSVAFQRTSSCASTASSSDSDSRPQEGATEAASDGNTMAPVILDLCLPDMDLDGLLARLIAATPIDGNAACGTVGLLSRHIEQPVLDSTSSEVSSNSSHSSTHSENEYATMESGPATKCKVSSLQQQAQQAHQQLDSIQSACRAVEPSDDDQQDPVDLRELKPLGVYTSVRAATSAAVCIESSCQSDSCKQPSHSPVVHTARHASTSTQWCQESENTDDSDDSSEEEWQQFRQQPRMQGVMHRIV